MNDKLLIIGAGVDRTQGIDFPLASTLLAEVSQYLAQEGRKVDAALREMLPGLRFGFNKMIAVQVDKMVLLIKYSQHAVELKKKQFQGYFQHVLRLGITFCFFA